MPLIQCRDQDAGRIQVRYPACPTTTVQYGRQARATDMLEVGVAGQNGHSEGGLTSFEERTHFGLWCDHHIYTYIYYIHQ